MANIFLKKIAGLRLSPVMVTFQSCRNRNSKHYDQKFSRLRKEKYIKIKLPDPNENMDEMPQEKVRQKMKERGILPPRPWMERPYYISATGGIFEEYVPPEGDGKASLASATRAKQTVSLLEKKSRSMMALRKVKSFDDNFDKGNFCLEAQDIYIKAHQALAKGDSEALRLYVTEKAHPEFLYNSKLKTIHWKFLDSLEPPRIVHARCTDVVTKENIFGQITVRFHTRQQLAIYDRFGRLIHGSEILAKDVLEYVVFERHLSNMYGTWRVHGKIIPDWSPPKEPSRLTRVHVEEEQEPEVAPPPSAVATEAPSSPPASSSSPALAQ